jgi:hypothetical protein
VYRTPFLILTAVTELATGIVLLLVPRAAFTILLDVDKPAQEALFVARIAAGALLAIGAASWLGRKDQSSRAQGGLLVGVLIYDVSAAALLAYAGISLRMTGIALWPAVGLHSILGAWCIKCLLGGPRERRIP